MADPIDIDQVRRNIGKTDYTDDQLGSYVDAYGVAEAISFIWSEKAATYADLADVNIGGDSMSFSSLRKAAMEAAAYWHSQSIAVEVNRSPVIKDIVRPAG